MASINGVRIWLYRTGTIAAATSLAFALSGCGDKTKVASASATAAASPTSAAAGVPPAGEAGLTPAERYKRALALMQQGQGAMARTELLLIQQREPNNRRVAMLLRQIDTDPRQLYGADSFVITLSAGDTLFSLAKKYLHDPLNFYGLARFNNLVPPADLKPGQSFSIPGRARMPERAVHRPAPVVAKPAPAPTEAATVPAAAPPADRSVARAEAKRLRAQGLEQMSAGSIDRAVALLSQAAALDPANGAIRQDLARARRIQSTVRSH